MPKSALKLCNKIISQLDNVQFIQGEDFYWSASQQTVFYRPCKTPEDVWFLLHEAAHALLSHQAFSSDIELLTLEADAWEYARSQLAPRFTVQIPAEAIEDQLATYRAWLDARSTCPKCHQNGLQTKTSTYQCINCGCSWMVNDARQCRLRRSVRPLAANQ